jgi:hypothetical protein
MVAKHAPESKQKTNQPTQKKQKTKQNKTNPFKPKTLPNNPTLSLHFPSLAAPNEAANEHRDKENTLPQQPTKRKRERERERKREESKRRE